MYIVKIMQVMKQNIKNHKGFIKYQRGANSFFVFDPVERTASRDILVPAKKCLRSAAWASCTRTLTACRQII